MLGTFTAKTFAPHVHSTFRIVDGPEVELADVQELGDATDDRRAPFSIVFRGPPVPLLPQRIYRLEHAELGAFDLFIVPIAPGTYEAVFT